MKDGKVVEMIDRGGGLDLKQKEEFKAQLADPGRSKVVVPTIEVVTGPPKALVPSPTPKGAMPVRPAPQLPSHGRK